METTQTEYWPALFPANRIHEFMQDIMDTFPYLRRPDRSIVRQEEHLTGQICKRLRPLRRYREGPLEFHQESNLPDMNGRADIRITCGQGIDTDFIVEAKRLFLKRPNGRLNSLVAAYTGEEGMMRFVTGKYAPYQQSSAMLGYVYDIDLAEAQKKIASKIDKCKRDLKLVQSMQESTLLVQPSIQETHHLLENNRRFLVYHIFAKIPNAEDALDKKKPHLTADF